jgi:hypothetical protein
MNDMNEYAEYTEYNLMEIFNDMESAGKVLTDNAKGFETIRDIELTEIDLKQWQQLFFETYKTARIIH